MMHVFNAALSGRVDNIKNVGYIWNPKPSIYFVAASETRTGFLPKILLMPVRYSERAWRATAVLIVK